MAGIETSSVPLYRAVVCVANKSGSEPDELDPAADKGQTHWDAGENPIGLEIFPLVNYNYMVLT